MTDHTWGSDSGSTWDSGQQWGIEEPVAPENLTAEPESEHEILLEWDIIGDVDQTNIYRAEDSGDGLGDYDQVATVDAPGESYTDADLTNGRTYYYRVATENTVGESALSSEVDATTEVPEPEISGFDTITEREIGVEIDPQDNNPDGDITVYRDGNALATVDRDTDEYTDDEGISDGTEYEYHLERDTGQASATGPPDTTIAFLPGAEGLSLDGTPKSELDAEWNDVLNAGEFRLEYRDDDPDGDHPPYELETTIAYGSTLEHTIEDVLDGAQFSVRIRTQTEDATGDWLGAEEITKLYSADTLTFSAVGSTSLDCKWANNSEFDGSNQIWRRRLYPNHDAQWRLIGTVASDAESFTDDGVTPDVGYEYYIRAQTPWIGTDSDTGTVMTNDIGLSHRSVSPHSWHAEIETDDTIVTPLILSNGTQYQPTLNGQPSATINVPRDEAYLLEQFEGAPMGLFKDGERRAVDELEDVVIETDSDELVAMGGTELEQEVEIDVDDRQAHALVTELIDDETDLVANIDAFDASIDEDVVVGDGRDSTTFANLLATSLDAEEKIPLTIDEESGALVRQPTMFVTDLDGDTGDNSDDFSGGEWGETSITVPTSFEHTIPGEHLRVGFRYGYVSSETVDLFIGSYEDPFGGIELNAGDKMEWEPFAAGVFTDDSGNDLVDDSFDGVTIGIGGATRVPIDMVVVYDNRYHESPSEWDNTLHEPAGYLERLGETSPVEIETDTLPQFQRAVAGGLEIDSDADAIDGFAISADNGQTWLETSDALSFSGEFDNPAPYIRARVKLGTWTPSPQDATPRRGYAQQEIDRLQVLADLDDTPLIVNHQDRGELGDVLGKIADQTEAVYEVWQDGPDTCFEWTWPGQRPTVRSDVISDYSVTKHTRRTLSCTVRGATQPVRAEEVVVDELGTTYPLAEDDVVRGKEAIRDENGERLRVGLDYELHGAAGEITILEGGRVDEGETMEVDYDYTVTGTYEHPDYDGNTREARTESISAARSERACEQAAKVIVDEASVPRWEADVTITYEDVQDIRLSDTLDIDAVPGDAEVVRELGDEGSQSGVSLRFGNRKAASERVSQIQSQLSSASDLV